MSNNCLVKKYKKAVSNSNLEKLGVLKLYIKKQTSIDNPGQQQKLTIRCNADVSIKAYGNGYFATSVENLVNDPLTSITVQGTGSSFALYFANDDYTVEISNKYALTYFYNETGMLRTNIIGINVEELSYVNALTTLRIPKSNSFGDIKGLVNKEYITNVTIKGNTEIYGDIANFGTLSRCKILDTGDTAIEGNISSLSGMTSIEELLLTGSKIVGNIDSLSSLIHLKNISLATTNVEGNFSELGMLTELNTINFTNLMGMTGSVEDFVAAQVANGRTTCAGIAINKNLGNVTFNGNVLTGSNDKTLSWTSARDIIIA